MKKCECGCGHEAQIIQVDLYHGDTYFLCANCHTALVLKSLSKKQFFALIKCGHTVQEFELHEDFYDAKTGMALQPNGD